MRKAVHRALVEEEEHDELDGRDGKGESQSALTRREEREADEQREAHAQHGHRLRPAEDLASVAGAVGRRKEGYQRTGGERAGTCARKPSPHAAVGERRVLRREHGAQRQDARRREEERDPRVPCRLEKGCELGIGPRAGKRSVFEPVDDRFDAVGQCGRFGERRGREREEDDADETRADCAIEGRFPFARDEVERHADNGGGHDQREGDPEESFVRAAFGEENRLELVDHVRAHRRRGAHLAADLEHLRGEGDGDEDESEVAEQADVLEEDDHGERQRRHEQHLVVGKAEAEDERREPEYLV